MLALGAGTYWLYLVCEPFGPRGGTWPGLIYGLLGYALILYLVLPGLGREAHVWPPLTDSVWRSGHPWLGMLSLPLVLFHSGFSFGGPVTMVLMFLFFIYTASSVIGLLLQRILSHMTHSPRPPDWPEGLDHPGEQRLHRWLHGWLVVHIPLSAALVALSTLHAILSLWY